jgi:hypothetical protein
MLVMAGHVPAMTKNRLLRSGSRHRLKIAIQIPIVTMTADPVLHNAHFA